MRKTFAMLGTGMFIAVAVGTAFAGEPGKDSVDHQFPASAVIRAEATNTGTIAGPSQPSSVRIDMRNDNREH